jgi:hypothetical protein
MTIGELVFWYACVFLLLLLAMALLLLRERPGSKTSSPRPDWRAMFVRFKEKVPRGDFWLKIFIAAFTALAAGVIIVVFVLPYGTVLGLGALLVTVAALIFFVPKLLA